MATTTLRHLIVEAPAEAEVFDRLYGYVPLAAAWVPRTVRKLRVEGGPVLQHGAFTHQGEQIVAVGL